MVSESTKQKFVQLKVIPILGECRFGKEYFTSNYLTMTWEDAQQFCRNKSMQLLTLSTQNESEYFTKLAAENYDLFVFDSADYYFIGGRQKVPGNVSTFYWTETDKPIDYKLNWAPGEPNNHGRNQQCLALKAEVFRFVFDDNTCDVGKRKLLCERSLKPPAKPQAAPQTSRKWIYYCFGIVVIAAFSFLAFYAYSQMNRNHVISFSRLFSRAS